jgi:hypothetical protein
MLEGSGALELAVATLDTGAPRDWVSLSQGMVTH